MEPLSCFAAIAPGLESALADELRDLGLQPIEDEGGVSFRTDDRGLYAANRWSRLAARILVRIGRFRAPNLELLAAGVRGLPWRRYVAPHQPLDVSVAVHGSRLRAREPAARKVEHAVADALRGPRVAGGRAPREPVRISVRIVRDEAEVSIDSSGELLHRRGWRLATAEAPLRENLAAAVLRLADWAPGTPLVDPLCGSGTFSIEAAGIALGHPPGAERSFAFERWPSFRAEEWAELCRLASPVLDTDAPIAASDRDPGAVRAARANAARARVASRVTLAEQAFDAVLPPAPTGLVVVNPPYGGRITRDAGPAGIRSLGETLRRRWGGWKFAILLPDPRLAAALGLSATPVARFSNGGLPVRLVVGEVG